mmetsp:Transcript_59085/g.183203  ORF Transcript_59085/g.183203 Transcript_59085/m.183203 type:complete len:510 (-) Transcript_59085:66-1595(-)
MKAESVAPQVIGNSQGEGEENEVLENAPDPTDGHSNVHWKPRRHSNDGPQEDERPDSEGSGRSEEEAKQEVRILLQPPEEGTPSKDLNKRAEERSESQKITARAAATNLITCMIGASVLSLPHVVARAGWVLGPLFLSLAGFVSCCGCLLINQAIEATYALTGIRAKNIGDLAEISFGPKGRTAIVSFTCCFQICKCGVYLLVIGTNLHYWSSAVSQRACTLLATVVSLRLAFLRDITVISRWSVIGVVASVLYLLTIAVGGMQAAVVLPPEARSQGLWPVRSSELPALFAVMLYTYSPADVLPVLKNDMQNPPDLWYSLCYSHLGVAAIYVSLAAAGYFGWGRQVEGNVLESMCDYPGCPGIAPKGHAPGAKWFVGYVLSLAVVSNLMVTIPVVLYCVFKVLEAQCGQLLSSHAVNGTMRLSVVLGAVSLAVYVPYFVEVLAVIATVLLVNQQIFVPVAVTFALKRQGASVRCAAPEYLLLGLGLCVFVVGMAGALHNLKEAIDKGTG